MRGRLLGHDGEQLSAPSPLMPHGLKLPLKASPAQPHLDLYIQPGGNLHFCSIPVLHSQWSNGGHCALLLGSFHGQILSIIQTSIKYHLPHEIFHKHPIIVTAPYHISFSALLPRFHSFMVLLNSPEFLYSIHEEVMKTPFLRPSSLGSDCLGLSHSYTTD